MKKIKLYLVRKHYIDGDYGNWELVMIEDDKDINEELAKKYNIKVTNSEKDAGFDLGCKVMCYFDYREIDPDRLVSLCL